MTLVLQRSMLERFEKCKRAGYWNYLYDGRGIEKKAMSVPLLTGRLIHEPLAEILKVVRNEEGGDWKGLPLSAYVLDVIVGHAKTAYIEEVKARGLLLDYFDSPTDEELGKVADETAWQVNEQIALLEALVKGWVRVRLPLLLEEFEIIDVEAEQAFNVGSSTMLTRRDGLLRRRTTGEFYVLSFKTTSNPDATWRETFRYDQQTISEFVAADESIREGGSVGGIVRGVIVEGLVKGTRSIVWPDGSGQRRHNSPLLYHYVEPGAAPFPDAYKASAFYTCVEPHPHRWVKGGICPGGKNHKLPDSYGRDMVSNGIGIDKWLDWLQKWEPELLASQFISLPAILRSEFDIERWKRTTTAVAEDLQGRVDELAIRQRGTLGMTEEDLDECFPMSTGSGNCLRPSRCSYIDLCYGAANPDDPEMFVKREFNHPAEAKLIQIGAAK